MNRKFLQSVLAMVALFLSSVAMAQVTTSANNPIVATSGTVVFKDQAVTVPQDASDTIAGGDTVVMRLPAGMNFSGTPTATGTGNGLQLRINASGDPGDAGLVSLSDTNADGGMDRAVVTIAVPPNTSTNGTVTWKGSVTYSGTGDSGTSEAAHDIFDTSTSSFIANNQMGDLADLVKAAAAPAPIALQNSTVVTVQNENSAYRAFSSPASYVIELPTGVGSATTNNTVTVTLGTGLQLDTSTVVSAFTGHTDGAPGVSAGSITDDGTSIELTIAAATTRPSQYSFTITGYETVGQSSPTAVNLTLSGDAGLTGSVLGANLAATGSTIALATTTTEITPLVRDAAQTQDLPDFKITEVFADDFGDGETITLIAPTGLTFESIGTTTSDDGTAVIAANAVNTAKSELTITITTAGSGATAEVLTITGVAVKAADTAAASLSITAGKASKTGESANAPFAALEVASAAARGAVTIAGPTTAGKVGAGTTGNTGVISLSEATYGAIHEGASSFPIIQVAAPTGITIQSIVTAEPTGTLDLSDGAAAVPADGTFIIDVDAESTTKVLATAPATLTVTYDVASTVSPGTAVEFTLSGNANVSGSATVADVVNTTSSAVSTGTAVPDQETDIDFVAAAQLDVKEEFAAAFKTAGGNFRIIAPAGITFATSSGTVGGVATSVSTDTTFTANDTLVVTVGTTVGTTVETASVTPNIFISSSAAAGFGSFSVTDGNLNDSNGVNVTSATVDLIYVGDVDDPDAGSDITVAAGFPISQDVTGGLADLSASSGDEDVATVTASGSSITVTGVAAGATTVTVTDALGVTDTVNVTVTAGETRPAVTTEGTSGPTDATIAGGITTDNGSTFATDGAVNVGDEIQIVATINVDSGDVGEAAQIVVAIVEPSSGAVLTVDENGALTSEVAAFRTETALSATEEVNVLNGAFEVDASAAGVDVDIYVGYSTDSFVNFIFNSEPIDLTVSMP